MDYIFIALILGCIPGAIAQKKGHSFLGWWLFGAALFIIALPASLMAKDLTKEAGDDPTPEQKKKGAGWIDCPKCNTLMRPDWKCPNCGHDAKPEKPKPKPVEKKSSGVEWISCPQCRTRMDAEEQCPRCSYQAKPEPEPEPERERPTLPRPVVLPVLEERECPYCAEMIKAKAKLCKHCKSEVEPVVVTESQST